MKLLPKSLEITSNKSSLIEAKASDHYFYILETSAEKSAKLKLLITNLQSHLDTFSQFSAESALKQELSLDQKILNDETDAYILGVIFQDRLIILQKGSAVYMQRGSKTGQIIGGTSPAAYGLIAPADHLLLCSSGFSKAAPPDFIKKILTAHFSEIESMLTDYYKDKKETMGVIFAVMTLPAEAIDNKPVQTGRKFILSKEQLFSCWAKTIHFLQISDEPEVDLVKKRNKRRLLFISVLLIFLLGLNIFFNLSHTSKLARSKKWGEVVNLVTTQYEEASSLVDLNPTRARSLLAGSKLTLTPLLKEFDKKSEEYREVNEWLSKISQKEVEAYKIYKFTTAPVFFDLTFLKSNGLGSEISFYKENKAILDTQNQVVYHLATDTKQSSILAGPDLVKNSVSVAIHGKTIYYLTSEGIWSHIIGSKNSTLIIKPDDKWGEIIFVAAFGGNLYLLDKKNHTVWKYIATEDGFSSLQRYLNHDVRVDFSQARKLVVDGSVWVAGETQVYKFNHGLNENFTFSGIADVLTSMDGLSTSEDDKLLYILDRHASRIIVYDKDGAYDSQYQWDELKNASAIAASEEEKKIFVLVGSKIYALDIKVSI